MTTRLPAWVEWGAWLLAMNAGLVNAIGLSSLQHQSISHVTGSAAWLGLHLAGGDGPAALHLALVIAAYFAGAAFSGWMIRDAVLRLDRHYGSCLLIEALLLLAALEAFAQGRAGAELWASAACGVQNALASTYSGAVVRTTHVTGVVTDLGVALGHRLRGLAVDGRRVRLHLLVLGGFVAGATIGAIGWQRAGHAVLWLAVGICLALAAALAIYRRVGGTGETAR